MPANTNVHRLYEQLKKQGHSEASSAKIAQAVTGRALKTGNVPKGK